MFRILIDLLRSLIWNKDLLLHANPYKTLKNVHTKNQVHLFSTTNAEMGSRFANIWWECQIMTFQMVVQFPFYNFCTHLHKLLWLLFEQFMSSFLLKLFSEE